MPPAAAMTSSVTSPLTRPIRHTPRKTLGVPRPSTSATQLERDAGLRSRFFFLIFPLLLRDPPVFERSIYIAGGERLRRACWQRCLKALLGCRRKIAPSAEVGNALCTQEPTRTLSNITGGFIGGSKQRLEICGRSWEKAPVPPSFAKRAKGC